MDFTVPEVNPLLKRSCMVEAYLGLWGLGMIFKQNKDVLWKAEKPNRNIQSRYSLILSGYLIGLTHESHENTLFDQPFCFSFLRECFLISLSVTCYAEVPH